MNGSLHSHPANMISQPAGLFLISPAALPTVSYPAAANVELPAGFDYSNFNVPQPAVRASPSARAAPGVRPPPPPGGAPLQSALTTTFSGGRLSGTGLFGDGIADQYDPGTFRSTSTKVALAGVSSAVLVLLLVNAVTRHWALQQNAAHKKARLAAIARKEYRRKRDAAGQGRKHQPPDETEDNTSSPTHEGGSRFPPSPVVVADGTEDAAVAAPTLADSFSTATTGRRKPESEQAFSSRTGEGNQIHSNRSGSFSKRDSRSDNSADIGMMHDLIRAPIIGEDEVAVAYSTTGRHGETANRPSLVVDLAGHDPLLLLGNEGSDSSQGKRQRTPRQRFVDTRQRLQSGEAASSHRHTFLPFDDTLDSSVAGKRAPCTGGFCGQISRLSVAQTRRGQQEPRFNEHSAAVVLAAAQAAAAEVDAAADIAAAAEQLSANRMRRNKSRGGRRRKNRREDRRRRQRRGKRHRGDGRATSARRKKKRLSDDGNGEERGFIDGLLYRLLMMNAFPVFTR